MGGRGGSDSVGRHYVFKEALREGVMIDRMVVLATRYVYRREFKLDVEARERRWCVRYFWTMRTAVMLMRGSPLCSRLYTTRRRSGVLAMDKVASKLGGALSAFGKDEEVRCHVWRNCFIWLERESQKGL